VYPNGPDCDPACKQRSELWELPLASSSRLNAVPNLGVSELVIVLGILLTIFGLTHLPSSQGRLVEIRPRARGTAGVRLRARSRWSLAESLLVALVVGLGLLALGLAVSPRPE
jgi:hypothetical protein